MPTEVELRTAFLVKSAIGYEVNGYPGVYLPILPHFDESLEAALEWYQGIGASDARVTISMNASMLELENRALVSLQLTRKPKPRRNLLLGTKHELAWFDDEATTVGDAISHFPSGEEIIAFILLNTQAGEVLSGADKDLRYFIRSNEQGHNLPHVHVSYRNEEHASICIVDGQLLAGALPKKALKIARNRILEQRETLLRYWNEHTNGVHFDINYLFQNQSL